VSRAGVCYFKLHFPAVADLEAGREAGVGVAVAQVGQGEQGLPARVQAPPPGSALLAVGADAVGEVVQGSAGQRDKGRILSGVTARIV